MYGLYVDVGAIREGDSLIFLIYSSTQKGGYWTTLPDVKVRNEPGKYPINMKYTIGQHPETYLQETFNSFEGLVNYVKMLDFLDLIYNENTWKTE